MSTSSVRAGEAYIELTTKDAKLVKGLLAAQAKLKSFGTAVTDLGAKFVALTGMIAVPLGMMTKNFADFDDQMRLVQGITGATDAQLATLTETAKKLGRETSYTAAQVAQGMVALARMGFTVDEVNRSMSHFMNLDRATGMNNLGLSAEIAANAMRSFGLTASDTQRIADVLTATANGSAQTLGDVGEALKLAAPNAHMANATLEDTCAMLGILANMGIKGSLAGTAVAKSFEKLATGKGVEILEGKGIKTKDANGNLRNMRDILADIAKVTRTMGTADKIAFLTDVFDVRGVKGGGVISNNIKDLDAMMDKIAKSGGLAEATARKMDSGIGGSFRIFASAVEGVGLEIGNIIGEYIKPYVESITKMLAKFAEWIKAHKEVVVEIVKVGAAVGAAGVALLTLGTTVKLLAFSCGGLATILKVTAVAVMLPVKAMGLLAGVVGILKTAILAIPPIFAAIKTASIAAALAIKAFATSGVFVKTAMALLAGAIGVAKAAILAMMGILAGATVAVRAFMLGLTGLKIVVTAIPVAFTAVRTAIASTVAILSAAKAAFLGLHLAINAPIVAIGLLHIAMAKIRVIFAAMSAVVGTVKAAIAGFNIVTAISSGIMTAWTAAMGACKAVVLGFSAAFGAAKAAVTGFNIVQAASAGIQAAWNAVVGASKAVMLTMTAAFATAKAAIVGFNIATAASRVLMLAWNGIIAIGKALMAGYLAIFGAAKVAITGFNIVQAVSTGLQAAWNAIMHAGTVVVGVFTTALAALKAIFLGLKVASIASWTAVLGPAIAFAAIAGVVVAVVWQMSDAFNMLWQYLKGLGSAFSSAFSTIGKVAKESYEAIKIAFSAGDLAGAAKVGLAALKVVWLAGIMPLKKAWYDFRFFLADSWTIVSSGILKLANNLWYGLLIGLKSIGNGIANAWDAIWNGVIGAFESTVGELKKKWIQFKGFFDRDVNIEAEIKKVDDEIAANKTERARRTNEAVNRRQGEKRALETERDQRNDAIDQRMFKGMRENQENYDRAMTEAAQGLKKAQDDWQAAVDEVKKKAQQKEIEASPATVEDKQPQIEHIQTTLESKMDTKAVSGFDARELAGLFGGASKTESIAERQAKTSEDIKRIAEDISTKLDKSGTIKISS